MVTFDEIVRGLLARIKGGRVTLRLRDADGDFPVVAEACAPGVWSIRGDSSVDVNSASTVDHLRLHHGVLVQEDLATASPAPPRELIDVYGARAQMLGAVVSHGELVGIISVHQIAGPRRWRSHEREALVDAVCAVEAAYTSERAD